MGLSPTPRPPSGEQMKLPLTWRSKISRSCQAVALDRDETGIGMMIAIAGGRALGVPVGASGVAILEKAAPLSPPAAANTAQFRCAAAESAAIVATMYSRLATETATPPHSALVSLIGE